jgi:molybdenum cofactor synthesis domain-containing protein
MSGPAGEAARPARRRTAAALLVGNELLTGKIGDQNLAVLARALRARGVALERAVVVRDELDVIAREVRALAATHDWVFTSGGVGPTHDDVTIDAVAAAFGAPVEVSSRMEGLLRAHYGERITEEHLLMARTPRGAKLVATEQVPWPTVVMHNVWVLPGVPWIFAMKLQALGVEIDADVPFVSVAATSRLEEALLKPFIDRVVADFDTVEVGSYPRWDEGDCKTRVTFDGREPDLVRAARDAFAASLPEGALLAKEG